MQALARVLFEVQARDADALGAACGGFNVNISVLGQRLVVLRDLVSLGQVRIKIIFTSEDRSFVDAAVQRHRGQYRKLYYLLIEHRQRARKPQAHRTYIGIGRRAKLGGASAKNLGRGEQLHVDFKPDHRLILRACLHRGLGNSGHNFKIIAKDDLRFKRMFSFDAPGCRPTIT